MIKTLLFLLFILVNTTQAQWPEGAWGTGGGGAGASTTVYDFYRISDESQRATASTQYMRLNHANTSLDASQALSETYAARAGTVKRFILHSRSNAANADVLFTLLVDGVASALVLTYPTGTSSGAVIETQDVDIDAGDLLTFQVTAPGWSSGSLFITSAILEVELD